MPAPVIDAIDHLVLTCADVDETVAFYSLVLGMERVDFSGGRVALAFGNQKINLHQEGAEFVPHAAVPRAGAGDFCLLTRTPVIEVMAHLQELGIPMEEGPVPKSGAVNKLVSIYLRDPDGNLVEISNEV